MKRLSLTPQKPVNIFFGLVALALFSLTACTDQDAPLALIEANDVEAVADEETASAAFDDLDLIGIEAMETADQLDGGRAMENDSMVIRCAVRTHDKENKTITIDFGDGCLGPDGHFRSGKIIIMYTQRMWIPGAILTFTLENYTVDRKAIEGTKTITNVSATITDHLSFNKVLEGGKITWPDGTMATREVDKTFTWVRENNPVFDQLEVEGVASGINRRGVAYNITILSKIIWKRSCRVRGVCIPVQGLKLIEREGHEDLYVDFGDGDCDKTVTLTKSGESRVVEVDC